MKGYPQQRGTGESRVCQEYFHNTIVPARILQQLMGQVSCHLLTQLQIKELWIPVAYDSITTFQLQQCCNCESRISLNYSSLPFKYISQTKLKPSVTVLKQCYLNLPACSSREHFSTKDCWGIKIAHKDVAILFLHLAQGESLQNLIYQLFSCFTASSKVVTAEPGIWFSVLGRLA